MVRTWQAGSERGTRRNAGFTLVEVLVALAVLSVATYVIIKLFTNSVTLGQQDRSQRSAYALAEGRLADLSMRPDDYVWPAADALAAGNLVEIGHKVDDPKGAIREALPPTTLPTYRGAADREIQFYQRFSWRAFVRDQDPKDAYCEVTVVVRWQQSGREQAVCLTTEMPRPRSEGNA